MQVKTYQIWMRKSAKSLFKSTKTLNPRPRQSKFNTVCCVEPPLGVTPSRESLQIPVTQLIGGDRME